jgi:hypothetical protein
MTGTPFFHLRIHLIKMKMKAGQLTGFFVITYDDLFKIPVAPANWP